MSIVLDRPLTGLRSSLIGEDILFVNDEGFCDGVVIDSPYVGLRAGMIGDAILFVVGDQQLEADGTLTIDKPYIGLVAGQLPGGEILFVLAGKQCEEPGPFTFCECEICCTLEATVEVGADGDPYAWSDPLDVVLTCGSFFQTHGGYYCLEEVILEEQFPLKITTTWNEKDTVGSPEAYTDGGSSGTRECFTKIWSSGDFEIDGETYRLTFWYSEATVYQTAPSVVTTTGCFYGYFLQHLAASVDYGDYWELVIEGGPHGYPLTDTAIHWLFTLTDDNPYAPEDCPDGYIFNGGDLVPGDRCTGAGNPSYTAGGSTDTEACPVYEFIEQWYRLTTDPDDDAHRLKCARITIADNCEPE